MIKYIGCDSSSGLRMLAFMGIEDKGVCALAGEECTAEDKLAEIRAFAKSL